MIELYHRQEPQSLVSYRRIHPNASWGEDEFYQVKNEIHSALDIEQEGLCVYCEIIIDRDKSHIEHIKPRKWHQGLTFIYDNLAQSCNATDHCGHRKGNKEVPIEPRSGCNDLFDLMASDGRIVPVAALEIEVRQKVETTLDILNLNNSALSRRRRQYALVILSLLNPADVNDFLKIAPFRHILKRI